MMQKVRVKKVPKGGYIVIGKWTINVVKGQIVEVPQKRDPEEIKEIREDVANLIEDKIIEEYAGGSPSTEANA